MKKFYGACVALLLSILFVFAGCKADGGKVLEYLKSGKEFEGNEYKNDPYRVTLTVNEDFSYSLSVSYGSGELKNYKTEGVAMEYLGCDEQEFTSEWLGVTSSNTSYNHVVRLNGATVEMSGKEYAFYLVANSSSKRSDSFYLQLVVHQRASESEAENLPSIVKGYPAFVLRKK